MNKETKAYISKYMQGLELVGVHEESFDSDIEFMDAVEKQAKVVMGVQAMPEQFFLLRKAISDVQEEEYVNIEKIKESLKNEIVEERQGIFENCHEGSAEESGEISPWGCCREGRESHSDRLQLDEERSTTDEEAEHVQLVLCTCGTSCNTKFAECECEGCENIHRASQQERIAKVQRALYGM